MPHWEFMKRFPSNVEAYLQVYPYYCFKMSRKIINEPISIVVVIRTKFFYESNRSHHSILAWQLHQQTKTRQSGALGVELKILVG